jgi:hypothetical protein
MACLRLLTVFPLRPDLSVPFFRRRIALATRLDAAFPYFRFPEDFRATMLDPPVSVSVNATVTVARLAGSRCAKEIHVKACRFRLSPIGLT